MVHSRLTAEGSQSLAATSFVTSHVCFVIIWIAKWFTDGRLARFFFVPVEASSHPRRRPDFEGPV